jgi:DNA-directed RNA polymerase specialized sigma24 family protein
MSNEPSASSLISKLRSGDEDAARILWDRFFAQLLTLTRGRLQSSSRAMEDEEDIVLSAMKSFCIGVRNGRFPELAGRESLWRLLLTITLRKLSTKQNYDKRSKRDVSRLKSSSLDAEAQEAEVNAFISRELNPDVAAQCAEQIGRLLESLEHDDLKKVALMKMEGYTNNEIATEIVCSQTSVERKLRTIRSIWSQS